MRRIVKYICNQKTITGKLRLHKQARALAVMLLIALLVTSLPASAGTSSHVHAARVHQPSFALQLYSDVGTTLSSIASWVRGHVRTKPAAVASQPYVPVAAYLNPAPPFISEPTGLSVTSVSATAISLSWTPPSGGADHYQVERSESISGPFFFVANASGATYNDTSVTNLHAYLYRVRAVSSVGAISTPSNMALGTAITFEFQVLASQIIKAQHYHDVRTAINLVRGVAGMSGYAWTRANLTGWNINASDTNEMRSALDAARTALSISVTAYTDPTLTVGTTLIKATHLEELQTRSTRGSSTSTGPLDPDSSSARLDPMNETGGGGENPLSRNFNWSLPVVSLPGRAGLDLGLTLSYNSLVWAKISTSAISFDKDNGFPGPGFRLGFPVIQPLYFNSEVGKNAYLLIGSDGSHTELRQVNTSALYESGDSSHMLLDTTNMVLSLTDGTQLTYELRGGEFKCAKIKDRNGNYITVSHNAAGRVDTITDTLGRVITFNYDANGWLTSITQQWNQTSTAVTHYWARFEYADKQIDTNFPGMTVNGPADLTNIKTLSRVKLADDSYFDFSYTSWGQVYKVSSYAPDAHLLNYRFYNLPQTAGTGLEHSDCPRFTERRDWAQYWNGDTDDTTSSSEEALTTFAVPTSDSWTMPNSTSASGVRAQVTAPDGTSNKIYYISSPGWQRGLIALMDTFASGNSTAVRRSMTTWTQDTTTLSYVLNPRVTHTNIYDDSSNRAHTEITYQQFTFTNGTSCHLPQDVYEYANDEAPPNPATMLRSTRTTYEMSAAYTDRHIFGLVSFKQLYEGNVNTTGVQKSKVGFLYDQSGSIENTAAAPTQHDPAYGTTPTGRGNLSSMKRYDVTSSAEILTASSKYNIAGALISLKDALNHERTIGYTDSFSDNTARNTFAYPTTVTDPDGHSSTAKYHFDFGAVTRRQTPQPNTATPQLGPERTWTYDSIGRVQQVQSLVNNSYTRFVYPTSNNRIDTYATIQDGLGEAHSFSITDGAGRIIATASDHPGTVNLFSGQKTVYDVMGRVIKTSNPAETDASGTPFQWTTAGNDTGIGWIYTQQTYDWKGRPLVTTNPSTTGNPSETTTKEVSYSGCGCAGGQVATFTDEGATDMPGTPKKRQQKVYADVLGRIVKKEVFNWDGAGSYGTGGTVDTTTVTTYDARDQITSIKQYAGTTSSSSFQESTLNYDGYGRLSTRHVPEQDAGKFTTWTYNADDTILTISDARNATSTHSYNGRHLLTGISYSAPAGITATASATFGYDGAGNKISMSDGLGSKSYNYDQLSRMTSETRTFTGVGTFTLSYDYNLGNQLKKITDASNTTINYNYNVAGQLTGVTGSDTLVASVSTYASGIQYRAWGGLKQVSVGTLNTSFSYDARAQVTNYNVSGLANENYDYYDDGRLKFVHNTIDNNFDRVFYYDHVGRVTNAFSGGGAHDGGGDIPFSQDFSYNSFGDLDQRDTEEWGNGFFADAGTFVNHRRVGWGYDASGRITTIDSRTYTYDAAGRNINLTGQQLTATSTISSATESGFDGEGTRVRENSGTSGSMTLKYYVTSSVIGNAVIEELNSSGQKQTGYVYTPGGTLLATQTIGTNLVKFIQASPHNTSERGAFTNGSNARSEFDAMGAKVRLVNLTPPNRSGDPGNFPFGGNSGSLGDRYNALENPGAGCTLDGIYMPCYMAMRGVGTASTVDYVDPFFAMTRGRFLRQQWVEEDTSTAVRTGENELTIYSGPGGHFEYVDDPDDVLETNNQPPNQNQNPQTRQTGSYSDLYKTVADVLKDPKCAQFASDILGVVSKKNPVFPQGGTLLNVFFAFLTQTKPQPLFTNNLPAGSLGYGNAIGNIRENSGQIAMPGFPTADGMIAELFHLAGSKKLYTDKQLAEAVRQFPQYAAVSDKAIAPIRNIYDKQNYQEPPDWSEENQGGYSAYFHYAQYNICRTSPTTVLKGLSK